MITIHQPNYWAYPGLIGKIMRSDKFVYLTKVQFDRRSWQNRNRIRVEKGWNYITVPIDNKGKYEQLISETRVSNEENPRWREKHLNAIKFAYRKAKFYEKYKPFIEELYSRKWEKLAELDIYITNFILQELKSTTEIIYDMDYDFEGEKNELLIDICKKLGEKEYMSNKGSENYVDIEKFSENGIQHIYINYNGFEYQQVYPGFEPGMSTLDMLLNCGPEETRKIIMDDANYTFSEWNKKILVEDND